MKKFAFLDVDQTLLYNDAHGNAVVNDALLDALLGQGIVDVYLFTNMSMKEIRYQFEDDACLPRYQLISYLKEKGFQVHGAITSADTGYYKEDGALYPIGTPYNTLYKPTYENYVDKYNNAALSLDDEVEFEWSKFLWDRASAVSKMRCETPSGQRRTVMLPQLAFYDESGNKTICTNRAELKSAIAPYYKSKKYRLDMDASDSELLISGTFSDNKALMMQKAAEELSIQHGDIAILFADDTVSHLEGAKEAIDQFNQNNSHQVLLETIQVSRDPQKALSDSEKNNYSFCASMINLHSYAIFLQNDTRTHAFRVANKGQVLANFIADLKSAQSFPELKEKLDDFYAGKNIPGSDYEILNRGQGITTRLFGLDTTTLKKINSLYGKVNLLLESVDSKEAMKISSTNLNKLG